MRVRHPPGRAGRPWLAHRLEIARRGAELLDEKHRALLRERRRVEPIAREARRQWESRAREAERWLLRAAMLGGERQLDIAGGAATEPAEVKVRWRTILGVTCPADAQVTARVTPELSALGGSAALLSAADAHRRALEAAAQLGVAEGALERIEAELRETALRRNAIERRWIPAHEAALAALEVMLEELEREDGARVRRVTRAEDSGRAAR
ncbi:MAG TPA: V-type ATP synthase subunit D [Methylomirabilota bacterium]